MAEEMRKDDAFSLWAKKWLSTKARTKLLRGC